MAKATTDPEENEKGNPNPAAGPGLPEPQGAIDGDPGIFVPEDLHAAGSSSEGPQGQMHGQFDGDELEFETWMFDAGDGRGVVIPREAGHATGPEAETSLAPLPVHAETPVQVSGHAVNPPDFVGSPVSTAAPEETADDFIHGSPQSLPADFDRMASVEHVATPTLPKLAPHGYPDTPSGWNDQMLALVDDFSSVLLAMRTAPPPTPTVAEQVPTSSRKSRSHAQKTPAETPQAPAEVAEPAAQSQPVSPDWSAPDEGLPPWLLEAGDETSQALAAQAQSESATGVLSSEPSQELPASDAAEGQLSGGEWAPARIEEPPTPTPGVNAAPEEAGGATPIFEPAMEMPQAPAVEAVEPLEAFTPGSTPVTATSEQEQPASQGAHGFNPDEMEFESFMFDQGKVAPLPSLPNIGEFMPAVRAMESAVEPHPHGATEAEVPGFGFASPVQEPVAPVDVEAQIQAQSQQQAEALASQVQMESVVPTAEDLPFWLEDRSHEAAPGGLPSLTAEDLPALPLTSFFEDVMGSPLEVEDEPEAVQAEEFDFTELPPIEPFDFSLIQAPEEEEELGFRTEDLSPSNQGGREPLVVTANLDVLADLLGKDIPSVLPGMGAAGSPEAAGTPIKTILNQLAAPEAPAVPAPADLQSPGHTQGWTATETSKLSGDTVSHLTDKMGPSGTFAAPDEVTDDLTVADLNVMPFDLTDLDLEEEETSTEYLETTSLNKQQTTTAFPQPDKILTGTLFGQAPPQEPEYWEAPDWMADVMDTELIGGQTGDELDTSRFTGYQQAEEDSSLPTQHMVGRSTHDTTTHESGPYEEFQTPIFRARVSRFRQPEVAPLDPFQEQENPQLTRPIGVAPFDYQQEPQYAPAAEESLGAPASDNAGGQISAAALTPAHGQTEPPAQLQGQPAGGFTSGPLPALEGFHHLQEIVAGRPTDIGARMALAVAYTQAGHMDHALYEYRRILQNRSVPLPMLGFIEDQINELEISPASSARFHQLRGDLYMKQGRYQEAIEEYNQIK